MSDAMKKTHNVVAVTGKYQDRTTGQDKNRYVIIGAAFTREDGSMAIKLESIPVGGDWNGWLNLYVPKPKDAPAQGETKNQGGGQAPAQEPFKDDDIPF